MREILRRVFQEGKFYYFQYERWFGYGYRLGQLHYETRFYRDGAVRSRFWGPGISETWGGKEGEEMEAMSKLTGKPTLECRNCKRFYEDCPKPTGGDDYCPGWVDKATPDAKLWEAVLEAQKNRDVETLTEVVKMMNHKFLVR